MRAWPTPHLSSLPAVPGQVFLHDSLAGQKVAIQAESTARIYACGITPYDATHLGHAFTYLSVDLLIRALLDTGLEVHYAQNVTDIDDPLLERAAATGVDWEDLAADQIELYRADMTALQAIPPGSYAGVVESMAGIVAVMERLRADGVIYQLSDEEFPDWYLDTAAQIDLAQLGLTPERADEVFAERGGDPGRPGKRHSLDYLVWRMHRPGEPAWDSSFGRGRPGWHVECTAIATEALGAAFDVQAGGSDLAFPHHPMCAHAAQVLTGQPFAKAYLHVGMVGLDGEKMSKSRGNLVFVSNLLASGVDAMTVRLLLLAHHYRRDWEYSAAALAVAEHRRGRWSRALLGAAGAPAGPVIDAIRAALREDLDAPAALAAVDEWVQGADQGSDPDAPAQLAAAVDALLGVRFDKAPGASR